MNAQNKNKKKRTEEKTTASSSRSNPIKADASIIQHIHYLYTRAKRKWKDDLTWHLQHVDFSKSVCSVNMLGKIYAEALQVMMNYA